METLSERIEQLIVKRNSLKETPKEESGEQKQKKRIKKEAKKIRRKGESHNPV